MEGIESVVLLTDADPGVVIAECADLEGLLGADDTACRDDQVSAIQYSGVDTSPIATEMPLEISVVDDTTGEEAVYETPTPTAAITLPQPGGDLGFGIQYFVPTELVDPSLKTDPNRLVVIHDGRVGAEESIRRHLFSADPTAEVTSSAQSIARGVNMTRGFTGIVTGIACIVTSSLLLAVALQTADGIEQRRRDTAALILAGTPHTMLRRAEAIIGQQSNDSCLWHLISGPFTGRHCTRPSSRSSPAPRHVRLSTRRRVRHGWDHSHRMARNDRNSSRTQA